MAQGPKMGELKRAARQLGVTSSVLGQQGWKTASDARIRAVRVDPPGWLIRAQETRRKKRTRQKRLRDRRNIATGLGIQARAVIEHDIGPGDVEALLAEPPEWMVAGQQRRQAQVGREARERLRVDLSEALAGPVHDVWFRELEYAATDEGTGAVDARWAPEVAKAKKEAPGLAGELTPGQVRARIGREREPAHAAGACRAAHLVRRALGGGSG
jgi:hypothetical protein